MLLFICLVAMMAGGTLLLHKVANALGCRITYRALFLAALLTFGIIYGMLYFMPFLTDAVYSQILALILGAGLITTYYNGRLVKREAYQAALSAETRTAADETYDKHHEPHLSLVPPVEMAETTEAEPKTKQEPKTKEPKEPIEKESPQPRETLPVDVRPETMALTPLETKAKHLIAPPVELSDTHDPEGEEVRLATVSLETAKEVETETLHEDTRKDEPKIVPPSLSKDVDEPGESVKRTEIASSLPLATIRPPTAKVPTDEELRSLVETVETIDVEPEPEMEGDGTAKMPKTLKEPMAEVEELETATIDTEPAVEETSTAEAMLDETPSAEMLEPPPSMERMDTNESSETDEPPPAEDTRDAETLHDIHGLIEADKQNPLSEDITLSEQLEQLDSLDAYLDFALKEEESGRFGTAIYTYQRAIFLYKHDAYVPFVAVELANLSKGIGDYDGAKAALKDALALPAVLQNPTMRTEFSKNIKYLDALSTIVKRESRVPVPLREVPKAWQEEARMMSMH